MSHQLIGFVKIISNKINYANAWQEMIGDISIGIQTKYDSKHSITVHRNETCNILALANILKNWILTIITSFHIMVLW